MGGIPASAMGAAGAAAAAAAPNNRVDVCRVAIVDDDGGGGDTTPKACVGAVALSSNRRVRCSFVIMVQRVTCAAYNGSLV